MADLNRIQPFPPMVGAHVFVISSSITATIGGATARGGYIGFIGYAPTPPWTAIIASVGAITSPIPIALELKSGTVGVAYSLSIIVIGGASPFVFSILSGSLPTGLTLNSATGVISGIPTVASTFTFTLLVTDVNNLTGTSTLTIEVLNPSSSGSGSKGYTWHS